MPIFKAAGKLVLYAHVPKCGGSAVSWYLTERFGPLAFNDRRHTRHDPRGLWSRTSPQHIDRTSLGRLFPDGFFDAAFTIVRHPVARLVSAYHFQVEVEKRVSGRVGFSDWLDDLAEARAADPFLYDNHVRPMAEIVPDGAEVFHMEHGLDALVAWFDRLTGTAAPPRALPRINERGRNAGAGAGTARITPTAWDLARIAELYAADFRRFGYRLEDPAPAAPAPVLPPELLAEQAAAQRQTAFPAGRMTRRLGRWIRS